MRIYLAWFSSGLEELRTLSKRVVIIDALRCSATIVTAFEHGIKSVIPVESVDAGRCLKRKNPNVIFSAEIDGVKVPDADVGNSPTKIKEILKAKKCDAIIIRTSAGTKMIKKALELGFEVIIIGTFLNARAVARYVSRENGPLGILCAGYKGMYFTIEDFLAAGAIIEEMRSIISSRLVLDDQALAAHLAFKASKDKLLDIVLRGKSAIRIIEIGEEYDIPESIKINTSSIVPVVVNGKIVGLRV